MPARGISAFRPVPVDAREEVAPSDAKKSEEVSSPVPFSRDVEAYAPTTAGNEGGVPGAGPIPELDALMAHKPRARVALLQGSFDWIHNGHLDLFAAIAGARLPAGEQQEPFDLVVVMPTATNPNKAFLVANTAERLGLIEQAVDGRGELRGRVVVSDAALAGGADPEALIRRLLDAYPGARFSFVLGADAFNQSARWPTFGVVEDNMDLVLVPRPGTAIERPERADHQVAVETTPISSTEVRQALQDGDLSKIRDRVPPSTYEALRRDLARRQDPAKQTLEWFR